MVRFFTSDQHFGHGGARGLIQRPFASVAEMDAAMVARWNEVVVKLHECALNEKGSSVFPNAANRHLPLIAARCFPAL